MDGKYPFVFSFAAVAVAAAFAGWKIASLTMVANFLLVAWLFVNPRLEFSFVHGDGWVAVVSFLLPSAIIATMAELMRRAQRLSAQNTLRLAAERERLRITLLSIGDAVVVTDESGVISFLNPVAERLTGWTVAEAQGLAMPEVVAIFNEQTGVPVENPIVRALRDRTVVALANHTILRPRGTAEEIPIEDSAAPIIGPDGSLCGAILVFHDVTARRIRERALHHAEWLGRTALEVAGAGAWVWDVERNAVFGDTLLAQTFGLPVERCRAGEPAATFLPFIVEEDRLHLQGTVARALETDEACRIEFRIRGPNGTERWVDVRGRAERDAHQNLLRVPGVLIDITERRAAEEQLRASEIRSKAIINTALDAVLLMNSEGNILDWNPAAERIFGWQRAELLGKELASHIIPERLREAHRRGLAHLLATGEGPVLGRRLELPALRRDGAEFPVELSISPLPGAERSTFVGFIRDLSQRQAAERELAERARLSMLRADITSLLTSSVALDRSLHGSCELLVSHLDAAFARVWLLDESGSFLILRASAGLYQNLDGAHARVPVGQFKIGRIAHTRRAHLTNDVAHDVNISDPQWAEQEGMIAFAGYPLIVDGRLLGVIGLFSKHTLSEAVLGDLAPIADAIAISIQRRFDDAALRAEKERAEVASRAKDDFLAALSHELRTPLMPVLMTASALREDMSLSESVRSELAMIERNIALEARLIDDLLDLTRITKGRIQLREEMCDVHSLIGLAVAIMRDEARAKPVAVELELSARRASLRGDPARLQQVVWNLLRNAIKFTPPGGRVSIRTRDETDGRLRIEVSDTGIGLASDALESIFHPFEQAGRENDHRFGGLGLGLAIARGIVNLHSGHIRAESRGPGTGATFVVELPQAIEHPSGSDQSGTESSAESVSRDNAQALMPPLRLLLVEDHEPTLTVLRRLLSRDGHFIVAADSVAAAVTAAETGSFDFVISDLGLPDGTGMEVMEKVRSMHRNVRGIALSGYGMEEDQRRSLEAGFSAHLIKPVDLHQLRRALRQFA